MVTIFKTKRSKKYQSPQLVRQTIIKKENVSFCMIKKFKIYKKNFQSWVHQAALGLPEEEQPPGSREQAVLHPGQEDGQGEIPNYIFFQSCSIYFMIRWNGNFKFL